MGQDHAGESAPPAAAGPVIGQDAARDAEFRELLSLYADDIVLLFDDQFRLLDCNERAPAAYGYARDELLALTLADLRADEQPASIEDRKASVRQRGDMVFESIHKRRDGSTFLVETSMRVVETDSGSYYHMTVRDISERKRTEAALQTGVRELAAIYANVRDVMFHLAIEPDGRFRFVLVNPAFLEVTGLTEDQVVGKLFQEVIPEPAHALVLGNYEEAVRTGKAVSWEEVSDYPTGRKYGEASVAPIYDADGTCTRLIGVVHDITKRKQAEEEIRRLNAELETRVLSRTAQLEASNKELEAFAYSVSHDLRAPLRAIDGFSQMVIEDAAERLDATDVEHLQRARAAARRMAALIDDLLGLSRISRKNMLRQEVDLSAVAEAVTEELREAQPDREVETVVAPGMKVEADAVLLRVILFNLLDNAWKFTSKHDKARIEVGATDEGGERAFLVRDDGAGFDMGYAEHLFGAFQRMHAVGEFEGDGIGLATAQRLVTRHGGRVWAEAEVEKGATFYFTLPEPTASG
jgi:PAS domain S-box-containing protein